MSDNPYARNWKPTLAKVAFDAGSACKLFGHYLLSAQADYDLPEFRRDRSRFRFYVIPFNHIRPANLEPYQAYIMVYDVLILDVNEPHVIESLPQALEISFEDIEAVAVRFPLVEYKPAPRREGE